MAELNDFAAWNTEFGPSYSTYVSDDFLDLAAILAHDVTNAAPEHREEQSERAAAILESQYSDEIHLRKMTVMALRALTMERIVFENVLDKSDEFCPIVATGTTFGCSYLRVASKGLEPVFGLQLVESTILTADGEPFTHVEAPLLIPLQDMRLRKLN